MGERDEQHKHAIRYRIGRYSVAVSQVLRYYVLSSHSDSLRAKFGIKARRKMSTFQNQKIDFAFEMHYLKQQGHWRICTDNKAGAIHD